MSVRNVRHLAYGTTTIPYELRLSARRDLRIAVHPDLRVVVEAPEGTPVEEVEERLMRRARWIVKRRRAYARYAPHLPPRQYLSGETHRYLGRQYRLKVAAGETEGITLSRPFIHVAVADPADTARVRALVEGWYRQRAGGVFAERLAACYGRVRHLGVSLPALSVRAMTSRWGSTSPSGRVTLNLKLVQVPLQLIDYVVCHELCHLLEPHHGATYYRLLGEVLPDWRERRERLNAYEFG